MCYDTEFGQQSNKANQKDFCGAFTPSLSNEKTHFVNKIHLNTATTATTKCVRKVSAQLNNKQ